MTHWNSVDFERLYKVLRVAAEAAFRDAPDSFNMGFSAQDVAHETFFAFLNSSNGLGWKPAKGAIDKFLVGVLWNKARSHLRRDRKVGGSIDDPRSAHLTLAGTSTAIADVQFANLREKISEALGDDHDLKALVAAAEMTSGKHNVNQELAEIMGTTVREVVNLKRRLLKNPKVMEILWPQKSK